MLLLRIRHAWSLLLSISHALSLLLIITLLSNRNVLPMSGRRARDVLCYTVSHGT